MREATRVAPVAKDAKRFVEERPRLFRRATDAFNTSEAQAAAAMLQRLLQQHNLEMADLEAKGAAAPVVGEKDHDLGKAAFKWKLDLANAIADQYYCYALVDDRLKTVRFVGRPDNVESLKMLYQWLIDQIRRIASDERRVYITNNPGDHIDPLRWQVQFGVGIVPRLRGRLVELKNRQDSATTALVVHHELEISDYLEEKFGYRADGRDTASTRQWREKHARDEELKRTDPEAYYAQYPWARPVTKTAKEQEAEARAQRKANEKWERKWQAQQERSRNRYKSPEQLRREEQGYTARQSGREAAEKVNLQPFIEGRVDNKRKVGG